MMLYQLIMQFDVIHDIQEQDKLDIKLIPQWRIYVYFIYLFFNYLYSKSQRVFMCLNERCCFFFFFFLETHIMLTKH